MPKNVFRGIVVNNKMAKTVTIKVERRFTHPLLKKTIRRSRKFHAHTDQAIAIGEIVSIEETKPISKLKRWIVTERSGGNPVESK